MAQQPLLHSMVLSSSAGARCIACVQGRRAGRQALLVTAAATRAPPPTFSVPGLPRIDLRELTSEAGSVEVLTDLRDVKVPLDL